MAKFWWSVAARRAPGRLNSVLRTKAKGDATTRERGRAWDDSVGVSSRAWPRADNKVGKPRQPMLGIGATKLGTLRFARYGLVLYKDPKGLVQTSRLVLYISAKSPH